MAEIKGRVASRQKVGRITAVGRVTVRPAGAPTTYTPKIRAKTDYSVSEIVGGSTEVRSRPR